MRGRPVPVTDGVAWPIPSISGAHAYDSIPRMCIANALRRGLALHYLGNVVIVVFGGLYSWLRSSVPRYSLIGRVILFCTPFQSHYKAMGPLGCALMIVLIVFIGLLPSNPATLYLVAPEEHLLQLRVWACKNLLDGVCGSHKER